MCRRRIRQSSAIICTQSVQQQISQAQTRGADQASLANQKKSHLMVAKQGRAPSPPPLSSLKTKLAVTAKQMGCQVVCAWVPASARTDSKLR